MTGNILKSTERFLKRCLKGKAAITTAMVVTFMMTGAVALAAETLEEVKVPTHTEGKYKGSNGVIGEDEYVKVDADAMLAEGIDPYAVVVNSNSSSTYTLDNYGTIEIEGTSNKVNNPIRGISGSTGSEITNYGTVVVIDNYELGEEENGGLSRGIHTGKGGAIYNHGTVDVTGHKARGINGDEGALLVNESTGTINIEGNNARGINVKNGEVINKGTINLKGNSSASGIYVEGDTKVSNEGTIIAEADGGSVNGIRAKNTSSVTNSGDIIVKGNQSSSSAVYLENSATFTNEAGGRIEVEGKGTAIKMSTDASFTNKGTIKVSEDATVLHSDMVEKDEDGKVTGIKDEYNVTNEGLVIKELNEDTKGLYETNADTIAIDRSDAEAVAYKQVGEDIFKATEVDVNGELVWTLADPADLPEDPAPTDPEVPADPAVPTPTNPNGECSIENADVYSSFVRYTMDVADMINDNIRLNGVNKDQGIYAGINGGRLSGDDYDFNLYGGYVGYNFDKGRGIAISMGETDGEFSAGDTSRDDKYYQLNAYITHDLNGFILFNNAFIGLTDSELEHHEDTKSYYIGTNTEISKRHDFNSFYTRPKAELNIMYIDQDSMENKECSVEEQEEWLLQVGVGSAIGKDFSSKLRVEAEAMVYMDIIDPYEDLDVTSHSNGTLTTIKAYDESVFYGKVGFNGVYESNSITVSTGVSYDIAEDNDFHVGGGVSYKF